MTLLITGASFGIGNYLTQHLLNKGEKIIGLARTSDALIQIKKQFPDHFQFYACDVSSFNSVNEVSNSIETKSLDGIICCAGIQGAIGDSMKTNIQDWQQTLQTNLMGTFHIIHTFFNRLTKSEKRAKVICFSGGGATTARENFSAYGVSKTAIVRLVETLAVEWKNIPIDINSVAPGAIHTRLTDETISLGADVVGEKEYQQAIQLKNQNSDVLDDVFGLIEFLLSDKSNGISGKLISAKWDKWKEFSQHKKEILNSDVFTLRRILPKDRGFSWD